MDIDYKKLEKIAISLRRESIDIQKIAGSGHLGGAFSAMEILTYLYFYKMNIDVLNPWKEDRDIFILSKGHASIGYYAALAERGFFHKEELKTYRKINSRLQGHSHIDSAPGIECSTGSLGQGLSFGIGLALGLKRKGINSKVYVMLGDGELQEGQVWEALMLQSKLKLDNLITIIDFNGIQLDDYVENIIPMNNLSERIKSFGFNTMDIDGNDFENIHRAFSCLKQGEANLIVAHTVKGKGISFMENSIAWHSKKADENEYKKAMEELEEKEAVLNG